MMSDFNEALIAARTEVKKIIDADPELTGTEVEEVRLVHENEGAWTFAADIPKLIEAGWTPGAVTVLIDKNDGHVLTDDEQIEFHKTWENARRRAGFIKRD
jgi:hypothetical protein